MKIKILLLILTLCLKSNFHAQEFDVNKFHIELKDSIENMLNPTYQDDIILNVFFEIVKEEGKYIVNVLKCSEGVLKYFNDAYIVRKINEFTSSENQFPLDVYRYHFKYDGITNDYKLNIVNTK